MTEDKVIEYKAELMDAYKMGKEQKAFRQAQRDITHALEETISRVCMNYRIAVPIYYPRSKSISLLLPLCLSNPSSYADVALVVERMKSGRYQGQTILTLDMAYCDARLICRPESEWLKPSRESRFYWGDMFH